MVHRLLACALVALGLVPVSAHGAPCQSWQTADPNGYCSECEIDVGVPPPPDVALSPSDSAQTIQAALDNPSYRVIEFAPGDYRAQGTLTLARSGTAGQLIWLRLAGAGTAKPWTLLESEQAILHSLRLNGVSWAVVHRLSFSNYATAAGVDMVDPADVVFDSIHLWDCSTGWISGEIARRVTLQNSYSHEHPIINGDPESDAVGIGWSEDVHIVNCELHDAHNVLQVWWHPGADGAVIDNCDIYAHYYRTDCNGNFEPGTGQCGNEDHIELKSGGSPTNPARIIHNRIFGGRATDLVLSGYDDGGGGSMIFWSGNSDVNASRMAVWWLVQDNILFDGVQGGGSYWFETNGNPAQLSFVGNLVYLIRPSANPLRPGGGDGLRWFQKSNSEVYLNTFIDCETAWLSLGWSATNHDNRGNVAIQSGAAVLEGTTDGMVIDYNVFYGTPATTTESPGNNRETALAAWAPSTPVSVGTHLADEAAGSIMKCVAAGVTGTTRPIWPALGAEVEDGTATWHVVRGPFTFFRRLLTGPEAYKIPYALPDLGAEEYGSLPGGGPPDALGARPGIGVNDDVAGFGQPGLFEQDLAGTVRRGTPGAIEYRPPALDGGPSAPGRPAGCGCRAAGASGAAGAAGWGLAVLALAGSWGFWRSPRPRTPGGGLS